MEQLARTYLSLEGFQKLWSPPEEMPTYGSWLAGKRSSITDEWAILSEIWCLRRTASD
jgi:hypothetical protein